MLMDAIATRIVYWYPFMLKMVHIVEVVELFKDKKATIEITLQQLASGGATTVTRRRYLLKERRLNRKVRLRRLHPK